MTEAVVKSTRSASRGKALRVALLLAPPLAFLCLFFAIPVSKMLVLAFQDHATGQLTLQNFVTLVEQPLYGKVLINTVVVSFIVVFLFTQSIGGLMGSAFYGSLVTLREKFHSNMLAEHVVMSDPLVAQRVAQLSGAYGKVIGDAALLKSEGISLLAQQISRESYMLAYGDAFLAGGVLASLALAALLVHLSLQALHRRFAAPQAASTAS